MVVKKGAEIWKYLNDTHNSVEGKKKWYLASDIDKRLEFYNEYKDSPEHRMEMIRNENCLYSRLRNYLTNETNRETYNICLLKFCFSRLDKSFDELLKKVK